MLLSPDLFCRKSSHLCILAQLPQGMRHFGMGGKMHRALNGQVSLKNTWQPFYLKVVAHVFVVLFSALIPPGPLALASGVYSIQELGLTGANYSYDGNQSADVVSPINASGNLIGDSARYNSSGSSLGQDAWYFNGSSTQQIGLTGTNYGYADSGGTFQYSTPDKINTTNDVIGTSNRYSTTGTALGDDSWYFNGTSTQQIGLSGTNYSYVTTGGIYEDSVPWQVGTAGEVSGSSDRYGASGNNLGIDSWYFNGSTTQQIGLTGPNYSYSTTGGTYEWSALNSLFSNAGYVDGYSKRYSSAGNFLGYDSWISNGSTTQQIGLTGTNYSYATTGGTYQSSNDFEISATGDVLGQSLRYSSSGSSLGGDAWYFNGSSTQQIGLTGTNYSYTASGGTYQYNFPYGTNSAGNVVGYSQRFSSSGTALGQDTWYYNGSTTQQIGLTGTNYSFAASGGTYQSSSPETINNAGDVLGYSQGFSASGSSLGQDAWYYNGSTTQQIVVTGADDSYVTSGGTYEYNYPLNMNTGGDAVGFSYRYNSTGSSLGQDGWFFDSATDTTDLLQFSVDSANGESYTAPQVLTNAGAVLGIYDLYDGSTLKGQDAFYWSEASGFHDLGTLVNGGLSASGWDALQSVISASDNDVNGYPQFVVGYGLLNGQELSNNSSVGSSVFLLSAIVPEPASLALTAIPMILLTLRRNRITTSPAN
jgi:hypothetical protein